MVIYDWKLNVKLNLYYYEKTIYSICHYLVRFDGWLYLRQQSDLG